MAEDERDWKEFGDHWVSWRDPDSCDQVDMVACLSAIGVMLNGIRDCLYRLENKFNGN